MKSALLPIAAAAGLCLGLSPARAAGDLEAGEQVFAAQCQVCHAIEQPENMIGPHLVGVFGRQAGSVEDFEYSEVMQESDVVWDEDSLTAFLSDPEAYMPGTHMAFPGVEDPQELEDLIAYLREAGE
jgi:cytochrome c2